MKTRIRVVLVLCGCLATSVAAQSPALPPVVLQELKALDETYVLLDQVADKVWPGWTGYRDWPFLFEFENGLSVLVGHPNPPKSFELVAGVRVGDRAVAVDRTSVTAVPLTGPFAGGGGLVPFGATAGGASVSIVRITLRMPRRGETLDALQTPATENKILMYVHELFHGYQRSFARTAGGNLTYNADTDYATWSNIEGLALDRAYGETGADAARERMKEFLVARVLKRRSMTDEQQKDESYDDRMEGTADYSIVRALEVIRAGGFKPKLTATDDPGYHGFAAAETMLADYRKALRAAAPRHEYPKEKCYQYGCFQALMCERLFAGWQARVQKGEFIDAILGAEIPIPADERAKIEQRLKADYPYEAVRADAAKFIDARDAAWNAVRTRTGRTYIVDLKATHQAVMTLVRAGRAGQPAAAAYTLGLMRLFPAGFPGFTLDEIQMSPVKVPAMADQLYYVKIVDTEPATHKQPYSVSGTKQADGTWLNATVTTPLFTLKAPKLRIRETGSRVKLQVLARVGGTT